MPVSTALLFSQASAVRSGLTSAIARDHPHLCLARSAATAHVLASKPGREDTVTGLLDTPLGADATVRRDATARVLRVSHGDTTVSINHADAVGLVLNLSGSHRVAGRLNGERRTDTPSVGSVTVMPPESQFEFSITGRCRVLFVSLPWCEVERAGEGLGLRPDQLGIVPSVNCVDDRLARLMYQMTAQGATVGAADALLEHLVRSHRKCGTSVGTRAGRGGIPLHRLRRVVEGIDRELARPLRLDDMADLAGMSRFHFAREFVRATGLSPHRFVVRRRLQRAVELLAYRALRISDVARLSGFTHASHLARHMYQQNGVTPAQLREHVLP